eukprot:403364099
MKRTAPGKADFNTSFESTAAFNQFSSKANERDAPNTVQEVLQKANDIPQILNDTLNLLPGIDTLSAESNKRYPGNENNVRRAEDQAQRERKRGVIMDFLTDFSAQSMNFLDSTVELVSKTNQIKECLLQQIQQYKLIAWNESTIGMFSEQVSKLKEDSQKLIDNQKNIMAKQRIDKVVEENIKNSVNLFSGAEHLQEIFDNIRHYESLIPKRQQDKHNMQALNRVEESLFEKKKIEMENNKKKQQQAIDHLLQQITKMEAKIKRQDIKRKTELEKDMIELTLRLNQLEEEKTSIQQDKIPVVSSKIQASYEEKRSSQKIEIELIKNDLVEKKKNKKVKQKKILGLFPDNSDYEKHKKSQLAQITRLEKNFADTYPQQQSEEMSTKKQLDTRLEAIKKELKEVLTLIKKEVDVQTEKEKYKKYKQKKKDLEKQLEGLNESLKSLENQMKDIDSGIEELIMKNGLRGKQFEADEKKMQDEINQLIVMKTKWDEKKEAKESNSMEIVQLIKLVRNLSTVAHYWTLLQQANNYVVDVLQRLQMQLYYILEAVNKSKEYQKVKQQKIIDENKQHMIKNYGGKKNVIKELEQNLKILSDDDALSQKFKKCFFENIGFENVEQLNIKLQANPKELKKVFPDIAEDFMGILKSQLDLYVKLKLNTKLVTMIGDGQWENDQNTGPTTERSAFDEEKGSDESFAAFTRPSNIRNQKFDDDDQEGLALVGIVNYQIESLQNMIRAIFDSQNIRMQLMNQQQLQNTRAIINNEDGKEENDGPGIIFIQQQRVINLGFGAGFRE